jgi:putative photosynthetic complex assembly protein
MNEQHTTRPFPRGPLLGAGGVVLLALVLASLSRFTGIGAVPVEPAAPIETRTLRFEDRPDGSVVVLQAVSRTVIETLDPGTNGFVRGVMRGLARERKLKGLSDEAPFELILWDDQRLSLRDTATGREIELVSFGITQLETFARMLHAGKGSREFVHALNVRKENQ